MTNKQNNTTSLILSLIAAILSSLIIGLATMTIVYTWVMCIMGIIPLWLTVVTSILIGTTESLLFLYK